MSASFKVDMSGLKRLQARFDDPAIKAEINKIPQRKAVAAIVGQAIADNFAQEGPGWAPLKAKSIRYGVSKGLKKRLSKMSDKQLLKSEAKARSVGAVPHRMILQKTGLLKRLATTPGASGSSKNVSGSNVYRVEGTNLVWGVDLIYAGVHQHGSSEKNIPARPYLKIRQEWWDRLSSYIAEQTLGIIRKAIKRGG